MDRLPNRVEMKELLQDYPSVKPGQESRAWKRLRTELYPKPDVVGLPRTSYFAWLGIGSIGGLTAMICALCWYEVMSPFGPDNGNHGGSIMPASLRAAASSADKPVIKDFKPLPQKTPDPAKSGAVITRPANES